MARGSASSPKRKTTKPISTQKRNRIASSIRKGMTRNEVARKHSVSPSTVTKIARQEGLSFDRSKTKDATDARQADLADRRANLAAALIDDAEKLRLNIWNPMTYYHFEVGKRVGDEFVEGGWRERTQETPAPLDQVRLITGAAIAIDKSAKLEGVDGSEDSRGALQDWWKQIEGS